MIKDSYKCGANAVFVAEKMLNLYKSSEMHIGIAGNIGSGKTTLTRMLSEHYGWTPKYEAVTYNPYLEDYYKDIKRWSFNLEVYFLQQRFKDVLEIASSDDVIIQDRTIFEGVYIFVANNKAMGNLSDRDYETYMDLDDVSGQGPGSSDLSPQFSSSSRFPDSEAWQGV